MPPSAADRGSARPASVINDEMRKLAARGAWTDAERAEYERLLVEWAAAVRAQGAAGAA